MTKFKSITKDTNLSKVLHYVPWDVNVRGDEYKVFNVYEDTPEDRVYYVHTEGGKWGDNSYWACPRDEEPSYYNLIRFDGVACRWGFNVEERNYIRDSHGDTEIDHKYIITITRNDEEFDVFGANDLLWGISEANVKITQYKEHQLWLNEYGYIDKIIGRKIRYRGIPAIIKNYCNGQACIIIEPLFDKDIDQFYKDPNNSDDEYMEDYYDECKHTGGLKVEILDNNIWWWYEEG